MNTDPLLRLRTLLGRSRPRLIEFFQDFDKLRHGQVTNSQFERVFGTLDIRLTNEEKGYILETYGTPDKGYVRYHELLDYLQGNTSSNIIESTNNRGGSRLGSTSVFSETLRKNSDHSFRQKNECEAHCSNAKNNNEDVTALLNRLKKRVKDKPIVGKLFFQDFDTQNCGLVSATQFGRSLSILFEALEGQFPTEKEIGLLVDRYKVYKPSFSSMSHAVTGPSDMVERKSFCDLTDIDRSRIEVDYRAFIYEIGAHTAFPNGSEQSSSESTGLRHRGNLMDPKERHNVREEIIYVPPPLRDMTRLDQTQVVQRTLEEKCLAPKDKLFSYYKRCLPNIPLFLAAKDTRQIGRLPPHIFVSTIVDTLGDGGMARAGLLPADIEVIAEEFYAKNPMDGVIEVNYRDFIIQLRELEVLGQNKCSEMFKMDTTKRIVLPTTKDGEIVLQNSEEQKVLDKLISYLKKRPILFAEAFKAYDKVSLGKVTSQQFKQVIAQYISIAPNSWETSKRDYDRFNKDVLYVPMQKIQKEKIMKADELVFTQRDLEILAGMFASDTIGARGDLINQVPSPMAFVKSGTLINYRDFLKAIDSAFKGRN